MATKKRTAGDDIRDVAAGKIKGNFYRSGTSQNSSTETSSKKRTAGDDIRDVAAGKISGNFYRNGIDNSRNYSYTISGHTKNSVTGLLAASNTEQKASSSSANITSDSKKKNESSTSSKSLISLPSSDEIKEQLSTNPEQKTSSSSANITSDNKKKNESSTSSKSLISLPSSDEIKEQLSTNPDEMTAQKLTELKENYSTAKSEGDNDTAESVKSEYDEIVDKVNKQTEVNRQKREAAAAETAEKRKAAEINAKYEEKYKNSTLEQRQNAQIHSADSTEVDWLNEHMYDNATSAELETQYKKLQKEYNSLYSSRDEESSYNRLKQIEDEQDNIKLLIDTAKSNEAKQAEYTDVINNDIKVKTVLQKYYALQDYYAYGSDSDEAKGEISQKNYDYINGLSDEQRNQIEKDFEALSDKGYDKDTLYKYYSREQDEAKTSEANENAASYAEEHPVLGSLVSVGARIVGAVPDAATYLSAKWDKTNGSGDGYVNPEATYTALSDTMRQAVGEKIDNSVGEWFYNTGMSIADFASLLPLSAVPGGSAMSLAIMGTSAGVSAANEVIGNGGSIDNAVATGFAAGIAEAMFEKLSLEQLSIFKASGKSTLKSVITDVLKGAFTEGSEEAFTDLANRLTDDIINGDLSSYNLTKKQYIEQGMSEEEAEKAASLDFWENVGLDFACGALSGGVMNIATAGINLGGVKYDLSKSSESNAQNGRTALADDNFDLDLLIEQGLAAEKGDRAYNLASKMQQSIEQNGDANKISAPDVGNLMYLIGREASKNESTLQKVTQVAAEKELQQTLQGEKEQINSRYTVQNNSTAEQSTAAAAANKAQGGVGAAQSANTGSTSASNV